MSKQHRRIIMKYKRKLTEAINWRKLLPKLIQYAVIDDENVTKRWKNHLDIVDNNQQIYSRILNGGPNAFDNFIQLLIDIGHRDLAAILQPVEKNGAERIDIDPDIHENHGTVLQAEGVNVDVNGNSEIHDREEIIEEESSDESDDEWLNRPYDPTKLLEISVKKSKKCMEPKRESYYMQGSHRGIVLIINNTTFLHGQEYREGATSDQTNIIKLFEQMGGFEIQCHQNLTAAGIIGCLAEFAAQPELRRVNSMFVFVMSHGQETVSNRCSETMVSGTDGEFVSETEIVNQFTTDRCVQMSAKPKILVFQNCRGERTQQCVNLPNDTFCTDMPGIKPYLRPSSPLEPDCRRLYSDILIAHATLPGHVAYRDTIAGSWYIQILCEVFMKRAHNTELFRMFQMVDMKMSRTIYSDHQTSSVTIHGFYKRCYINPGYFTP